MLINNAAFQPRALSLNYVLKSRCEGHQGMIRTEKSEVLQEGDLGKV
jgi:hypothetical protein